jgi:hypothetical protein
MTLSHLRAWLGLALMFGFSLAGAAVPGATAEALMQKSGVTAQLGDVAPQVLAGIHQSAAVDGMDRRELARLEELAQESFATARLQAQFAQVLAQRINPAQAAAAQKWYDSPTGARITALEVASSAQDDDPNQVLTEGNQALAQASGRRQALLTQLVKASLVAEAMVTLQINTTLGVVQGVASVSGEADGPSLDGLRSRLEAQRQQMLAAGRGLALTLFARTYQSASDKALEQYLRFLDSPAGTALSQAMVEALDQTLSSAAQRLGRGLRPGAGTSL